MSEVPQEGRRGAGQIVEGGLGTWIRFGLFTGCILSNVLTQIISPGVHCWAISHHLAGAHSSGWFAICGGISKVSVDPSSECFPDLLHNQGKIRVHECLRISTHPQPILNVPLLNEIGNKVFGSSAVLITDCLLNRDPRNRSLLPPLSHYRFQRTLPNPFNTPGYSLQSSSIS